MPSCDRLLKAIEAYLEKADDDLAGALGEAGFIDSKKTVSATGALEENLANTLKLETARITAKVKESVDLAAFSEGWPAFAAGDNTDELLAEIFLDSFTENIPKLASGYIKRIDPQLTVSTITNRTTAWAQDWSADLGKLMKLNTHGELEKLLTGHLRDGKSIADFTRALMDSGIRDEYAKARRAALTEMLRAHSVAQQEALIQNPAVEGKMWRHTGSYRNNPRQNHVDMDGVTVPKDQPFALMGADGGLYFPMYPRDSNLPPGESVNCHCIHQGIVNKDILGLSLEERQALQAEIIKEDDGAWIAEMDAENRAKAGIELELYNNPDPRYNYGTTDTSGSTGKDSLAMHRDTSGNLTPEREALHQKIIDDTFADFQPTTGEQTFTIMGGGAASGKSTILESGTVVLPDQSVVIDPDAIKKALPEYKVMTRSGAEAAAKFVHEESSALAKRITTIAHQNGYNSVLDGVGANVLPKIEEAKSLGVSIQGVYVTVPTETAIERATVRGLKTGRHVPVTEIMAGHEKVSRNLPEAARSFSHDVLLYNTEAAPILIATGGRGSPLTAVAGQEDLFDAFLQKGARNS